MRRAFFLACLAAALACFSVARGDGIHHYVFFGQEREQITNGEFLDTKAFEGAQLKYTWRELEHTKDEYDFGDIEHDLASLQSKGKKLFIQVQDSSFDVNIRPFPHYLLEDPAYHGGADPQCDEKKAPYGWVARRWDPAVRARFHGLLLALGKEFDGRIEGINLPETAIDVVSPPGFTPENYCEAVITNLMVLKRAFPKSVTMQYANFMPGDRPYLERVFKAAIELKVGLGGPDLLPYKPYQMENSYSLMHQYAGIMPMGIAVQDGNYGYLNRKTGKRVTVPDLVGFAKDYLKVDYIFWCTQEPYFSQEVVPFIRGQ
jgi:hypothetical protein